MATPITLNDRIRVMLFTIVILAVLAAGVIGYTRWNRYQARKARRARLDPNSLTTSEQKSLAIETATDPGELRAMWAAWRLRGWAEGGMLHVHVLDRLDFLGADLSLAEEDILRAAPERFRRGAELPRIRGNGGGEGQV